MNKHTILSSGDWLLLSAYLDDQLSKAEKRQMDERLQTDPEYCEALENLRRTSSLLRALPVRRAPRNFTLSKRYLPKRSIPSLFVLLRFSSAAAGLLLIAAFALDLTQNAPSLSLNRTAENAQPAVAMESAKISAAETPAVEPPMIIFWGAPAPMMGAYGKGGGGGGAEGSGLVGGGAAASSYGVGGGVAEDVIPEAAPSAEMPAPDVIEEQKPGTETRPQTALVPEPLTGSGPILGVKPAEGGAAADNVAETPLRQLPAKPIIPFRLIEIVLAALMILTAIPAWLLRRK